MVSLRESDGDLWVKASLGDGEAFGRLFERHVTTIYNYCFRRVGNWALAEDLTSVVFIEAWRRRETQLPNDKILPWLLGVATNVVRNSHRSLRRHRGALKRVPAGLREDDFADEAASRLDDEREMHKMLAVLAGLPRREQDVFVLCVWQELTYEETALALSIPVGTVRSRLSRARQTLRSSVPVRGV